MNAPRLPRHALTSARTQKVPITAPVDRATRSTQTLKHAPVSPSSSKQYSQTTHGKCATVTPVDFTVTLFSATILVNAL